MKFPRWIALSAMILSFRVGGNAMRCEGAQVEVKAASGAAVQAVEAAAQPAPAATPPGGTPPGATAPMPPGAPGRPGQPGAPATGAPANAKPEEKDKPKTITRPNKPEATPDPAELEAPLDENAKVRFRFRGQPWPEVLEWLARISGLSLDWQELPADYLNLTTQREYSVEEARDLINRHLLARGFTLLQNGELLTVANVKTLDPGMVPRVMPEELAEREPHEYVKVSFKLDWLIAEQAVEELKPMLSPNGKLTALKSTNRIEALDAVINLRQIAALLRDEQSDQGQERLVREFVLKHTRAAEVHEHLLGLLGLEAKSSAPANPADPRVQMEMQQRQAMMMAQMQQQGGAPQPPKKEKAEVHLVVNHRKNSILAHADPDKLAIIEQAIQMLDVAGDGRQSLLANSSRMQVYRLATIDPEPFAKTLQETGDLDPTTRLEVDRKNRAIIAFASLADHMTIRALIEKLDGSGRKFEVIQLRRLEADYVAGTVEFMMGGQEKEKGRSNRGYMDFFGYYGPRRDSEEDANKDQFRVDADVEFNRLLVWANDIEMEEVRNLLIKLGEIPAESARHERTRLIDSVSPEDAAELMERLRRAWPSIAPNPLQLPHFPATPEKPAERKSPASPPTKATKTSPETRRKIPDWVIRLARAQAAPEQKSVEAAPQTDSAPPDQAPPDRAPVDQAQVDQAPASNTTPAAEAASGTAPPTPPARDPAAAPQASPAAAPLRVTMTPDGRLLIASDDPQALDLFEELVEQLAPPRRDYRIFYLKNARAYWVALNIKEFFEEKKEKNDRPRYPYYYDFPQQQKDEPRHRLSRRRPVKIITDSDTNTILVQGADAAQLKTISDLIELYDVPEPTDSQAARMSGIIAIKYSKAIAIAEAVKDVYRDLLSSNDRALANQNPQQGGRPASQNTYILNSGGSDDEKKDQKTQVSFKGKLSIGVDELSNSLIVSAEGENLYRNVTKLIEDLDKAAKPVSSVGLVTVRGNVNPEKLQKALQEMFKKPNNQPGQPQPGQPGHGQPGQGQPMPGQQRSGERQEVIINQ